MGNNNRESLRLSGFGGGFLEQNFPTGGGSVFQEEYVTRSFGKVWKR
jgi:hypothetical protein